MSLNLMPDGRGEALLRTAGAAVVFCGSAAF
jgi:hypothetical protein